MKPWPRAGSRCPKCWFHVPAARGHSFCDVDDCPLPRGDDGELRGWESDPDAEWGDDPTPLMAQELLGEFDSMTAEVRAFSDRLAAANTKLQILVGLTGAKKEDDSP